MARDIVETKTYDFDQMLKDQAAAATHPAAIAPLIALARQAGSRGTARALQKVEKALTRQLAKDERRYAKERAKLDRAAAKRDRALERALQQKGKTWDDAMAPGTPRSAEPAAIRYVTPRVDALTYEEQVRQHYADCGVDYDRVHATGCTSSADWQGVCDDE